MPDVSVEAVDALLPQTQCGLCSYGGCLPYATAIVSGEAAINRCPPGGLPVLNALGTLMGQSVEPYVAAMRAEAKPAQVAAINEALCIGCTKCIAVCPVDAIIGAPKHMHGILSDACTGCGLCLPPCPMDCISLETVAAPSQGQRDTWRVRHQRHLTRMAKKTKSAMMSTSVADKVNDDALSYIAAALARKKVKDI